VPPARPWRSIANPSPARLPQHSPHTPTSRSFARGDRAARNTALIIATGPLTSDALAAEIGRLTGGDSLSFYDAVAPTVTFDSLDMSKIFRASRRGKGSGKAGSRP